MVDSYEVGQKLTKGDFVSDWYFPWAKWDYVTVNSIEGDAVELEYVQEKNDLHEIHNVTKDDMETMLGWSLEQGDEDVIPKEDVAPEPVDDSETTFA